MLHWYQKFLGIPRLDAESPVERRFPIIVPYSRHLIYSFVFISIHKRGVGHIYRWRGPGKIFWGSAPDHMLFGPLIRNADCATEWARFHRSITERKFTLLNIPLDVLKMCVFFPFYGGGAMKTYA